MSTDATATAGSGGVTAPSTAAELLRLRVPDLKAGSKLGDSVSSVRSTRNIAAELRNCTSKGEECVIHLDANTEYEWSEALSIEVERSSWSIIGAGESSVLKLKDGLEYFLTAYGYCTFRNLTFTGSNKNALWAWSGVINVDHVVFECDYGAGCTGDNGWAVNTVGHYGGKMTGGKTAKFKFSGPAITSNSPCCEPAWNPAGPHPYCTSTWDCPKTY